MGLAFMVAGCSPNGENATDAAAQNRAYLSQANTAAMKLTSDFTPFNEAVAQGDIVTMENAAAEIYRDFDAFKELSAPEAMKDIHTEYCAGCDDLKQAVQGYVSLYRERNGSDMGDAAFNARIADIQKVYDSGIAHLQSADDKVKALPGATPSSSSTEASK